MLKGGYQIVNLKNVELSGTAFTMPGIYSKIAAVNEKVIMITGLNIEGEEYKDYYTQPIMDGTAYKLTVGRHTLVITADDSISTLDGIIGGGGDDPGITSYEQLSNKPQINGVTLSGNKTLGALGIQPELSAGQNINISGNQISAVDTKYTAGANVAISDNNVISATDTKYSSLPEREGGTDWSLVTTGEKYEYSHKQDALTAGANVHINNGVISADDTTYEAGQNVTITTDPQTGQKYINASTGQGGTTDYTDLTNKPQINNTTLSGNKSASDLGLQETLTAGTNIHINNGVISADDTTYTAGSNVQINNGVISATDTTYGAGTGISIDANNDINVTYGVELPVQAGAVWSLVTTGEKYTYANKMDDNPTFSQASTRANIISGESFATILGKIRKWFADIKNGAFLDVFWSSSVSCAVGATTVTITDANIATTSVIEPFTEGLTTPVAYNTITVTSGQAVITFDALETACSICVRITNR